MSHGSNQLKKPVILITGKNGQVGWELQRALSPLGHIVALSRDDMDLSDSTNIRAVIKKHNPDIIVNAAAYTAVDKAETDQDAAMQINGIAPGIMAEAAKESGALLIHYSTDYVFDGTKESAYLESDATNPINEYGRGKLVGEQNIQASEADYIILRTSWVYASRGTNFLHSILRLASDREELGIVADQIGSPTTARFIADVTAQVVQQSLSERALGKFKSDLYHLVTGSETSWHGFATEIVALSKQHLTDKPLKIVNINPITTEEYPVPAPRPKNSRLSTDKLSQHFSLFIPDWDQLLALCIQELE